ncbi:60S ribosomal protein L7a [Plecturocebus cupreus]
MRVPYCINKGKARMGHLVHKMTYIIVTFTQANLEDKGVLAKLLEATKTSYNKYDEIHHHKESNVLGPKSVAHIAKLEMAKATEFAT